MDPYDVLTVERNASQEQIKKQFRKLSLKHHPDRNGNSTASTNAFKEIMQAYNRINTPEKRADVDRARGARESGVPDELHKFFMHTHARDNMHARGRPTQQDAPNPDFASTFSASLQSALQRPPPIVKSLSIAFEASYHGGQIPILIERQIKTSGMVEKETETIYVTLPPGIDDNEMIVVKEKGNIVDNVRGDLKVFVTVEGHPTFIRSGLNLIHERTIALKSALCGFTISIPYFNGKTLKIHNKSGTIISPNFEKTIPKYGFKRDLHTGSLIIRFKVKFPDSLDPSTILALARLLPDN